MEILSLLLFSLSVLTVGYHHNYSEMLLVGFRVRDPNCFHIKPFLTDPLTI